MTHPLFTGSVALLAVNDHLLKGWAPGWFTGKASDVAGVVVAAVLAGVVLRWPTALAATAVAWVGLKTVPEVSALVAPVLGGPTRTDPTDLVALVGLWPAARVLGAVRPHTEIRALLVAPILTATVLATTATSCEKGPMVSGFVESDGVVTAVATIGFDGSAVAWATSRDGGLTWARTDQRTMSLRPVTEACRSDGRCFRVLAGRGVQELLDGDWQDSFAFSDEQDRRMKARTLACDDQRNRLFEAVSTASTAEGDVVLVSMADQGLLRLDPATRRWERIAVADLEPVSLAGPSWLPWLYATPLALALAAPVLGFAVRPPRWWRRIAFPIAVAAVGAGSLAVLAFLLWFSVADYLWAAPTIAGLSVLVFLASLWLARRPGPELPPPPRPTSGLPPPPNERNLGN